jgi:hypothetical protein
MFGDGVAGRCGSGEEAAIRTILLILHWATLALLRLFLHLALLSQQLEPSPLAFSIM